MLLFQIVRNEFARQFLARVVIMFPQSVNDFFLVLEAREYLSVASADGTAPPLAKLSLSILSELVTVEYDELVTALTVHGEEHARVTRRFRVLRR